MTFECVRMNILCVLHVNQYCTHLVAFLVSFVHPTLSKYQNQTSTFYLSTVYTILDYEYRLKNKGTGLVLVPVKCGVYN